MSQGYELKIISGYISNLVTRTPSQSLKARMIVRWLIGHEDDLGLGNWRGANQHDDDDDDEQGVDFDLLIGRNRRGTRLHESKRLSPRQWAIVKAAVADWSRRLARCRPDIIEHNLKSLAALFGLSQLESALLRLILCCRRSEEFECLVYGLCPGRRNFDGNFFRVLAAMLGSETNKVQSLFAPSGTLANAGILSITPQDRDDQVARLISNDVLAQALVETRLSPDGLRSRLTGKTLDTDLKWDDFDHIAAARDTACKIIEGALSKRATGINILVYGSPGTGKTEFCKVLATAVGAKLFAVAEADGEGLEPSRNDRLAALRSMQMLLQGEPKNLLLFDEMEDMVDVDPWPFGGHRVGMAGSRVYRHRMLEKNPVPVIWTCNQISRFDDALLRRMTFAIQIKVPPPAIRERVWGRVLNRQKLNVPPETVRGLARDFKAPPAMAANAVRAAKLAGGEPEILSHTVKSIATAMQGGWEPPPSQGMVENYQPSLVNASTEPRELADRLAAGTNRHFSLCLFGPPGTGKSAYARYLGERLGMEVIQKRASDLMSMWVGMTEANIAEAFSEAKSAKAVLVFDEADSFLGDRANAGHSWEVSQVNEMLTWMESHPLPFICTTNLETRLDPASLRRFTFKLCFTYLRPEQASQAFRHYFGREAPPDLARLPSLTPGDYALVQRRAGILGLLDDPDRLLAMLEEECAAKPGAPRSIGFAR